VLLSALPAAGCGTTSIGGSARAATTSTPTTSTPTTHRHAPKRHRHRQKGATVALERIIDGDTIVVSTGAHIRLLQVDTPELSSNECYSTKARTALATLLPAGSAVRLEADPALDRVDRYGRLLRYVYRAGANVNVEMVRRGAAAPYFYGGERGRFAARLYSLAVAAKRAHRGLWGACPTTQLRPDEAVDSGGPARAASGGAASGGSCEPGYSPCLPITGDLDCADIADSLKPIHVTGSDPYRLDGNGDGLGCT
jgi:endonuclease YncB( thermonuclease family)